ncbi:lipopolysaccharide biosynthesis protein [Ekhidna sp.]
MTRIYPAEAYGGFAYLNSLVMILSAISTLKMEGAILIAKENEVKTIAKIILICSLLVSSFSIFWGYSFGIGENYEVLLIPILVFLFSIQKITNATAIRYKHFSTVSKSRIIGTIGGKMTALLAPLFFHPFAFWLLISEGVIKTVEIVLCKKKLGAFPASNVGSKKTLIKYRKYPLYSLPSNLMALLVIQVPIYSIGYFFNNKDLGHYSLASTILSLPSMIVIQAVAPIFVSSVSEELRENGKWDVTALVKNLLYLVIFMMIPLITLQFFGNEIFSFAFGIGWAYSGTYASILSISFFFIFLTSSVVPLLQVKERQESILVITILQVVFSVIPVFFLWILDLSLDNYLLYHSISISIISTGILIYLDRSLPLHLSRNIYLLIVIFVIFYIISFI